MRSIFLLMTLLLISGKSFSESFVLIEFDSFSEITGVQGDATEQLPSTVTLGEPLKEIHRLRFYEKGDEPCAMTVDNNSDPSVVWDQCNGKKGSLKTIAGRALTQLRVCTNKKNNARGELIKGVDSVWVNEPIFNSGGESNSKRISRANCRQWKSWVECPAQTVAGAIIAHSKTVGGRESIVGLQMACYRVAPLSSNETAGYPYPPAWDRDTLHWAVGSGELLSGDNVSRYDYSLVFENQGFEYFLNGFSAEEDTDEPVDIGIYVQHAGNEENSFSGVVSLRNNRSAGDAIAKFIYPENSKEGARREGLDAGQFNDKNSGFAVFRPDGSSGAFKYQIRALGVCTSNSGKVKGVRINYVLRDSSGDIIDSLLREDSIRSCNTWRINSSCALDEAAVGYRLLFTDRKGLTGVALQCARVIRPEVLKTKSLGSTRRTQ